MLRKSAEKKVKRCKTEVMVGYKNRGPTTAQETSDQTFSHKAQENIFQTTFSLMLLMLCVDRFMSVLLFYLYAYSRYSSSRPSLITHCVYSTH